MLYLNFFIIIIIIIFFLIFLLLLELFILGYIYIYLHVCVAYPLNVRSTMEIRRSHLCDFFLVFPFL